MGYNKPTAHSVRSLLMRLLLVLLLSSLTLPIFAAEHEEIPPSFAYAQHKGDTTALSMSCEFKDASKRSIACKFEQVRLALPKSTISKEMIALILKNHAQVKTTGEEAEKACAELSKNGSVYYVRDISRLKRLCSNTKADRSKLISEFFTLMVEEQNATCKIYTNSFDIDFKKVGDKWVSDTTPKGICDVSNAQVIEKEGPFWSFTQTRIAVGDSKSELCKTYAASVGKPDKYEWISGSSYDMSMCKYTVFGT